MVGVKVLKLWLFGGDSGYGSLYLLWSDQEGYANRTCEIGSVKQRIIKKEYED